MESPRFESIYTRYPNNLPLQPSSFIGREHELSQLKQLIWSTRLLTLTGPGGCGKTRLALKVAEQLLDAFSDGAWFVDFASLPDTGPVPQTVASVFAIRESIGRSFSTALIDYLCSRELLIILDNCEHVLPACAELATALLRACPNLYLVATSREKINIDGEIVLQTPPLSTILPSAQVVTEAILTTEATSLFIERAKAVQPSFVATKQNAPLIAQICHQLDGLPLAIELAAAHISTLSVEQIAERLVDRFALLSLGRRTAPARHQTLRAMIDWSYGLLSAEEKKLFHRLAVFAGGWTIEAVESVCSDDGKTIQVNDKPIATITALSRLVEKSLVIADASFSEMRYGFLETIRQYAREKLMADETTQPTDYERTRGQHLTYFEEWVEKTVLGLMSQDHHIWLDRYELEHENIRAALEWGLSNEQWAEQGLHLAVTSSRYFLLRGYISEGRTYLSAALKREQPGKKNELRALGLTRAADLAYYQSDFPSMRLMLDESLSIWRELGLERGAGNAEALQMLGEWLTEVGDYATAYRVYNESLTINRELNNELGICDLLMLIGWVAMRIGDYGEAQVRLGEFLALARKTGYAWHIAFALSGLGELAIRQGQYEYAGALLEEALALRRAHADQWGVATALGSLGWAALRQGDYGRMRAALKESATIHMEIGDKGGMAWCLEKLAEGIYLEARTQSATRRNESYQRAVCVYGAAAAIRAPIGSVIDQADQGEYVRKLAELRKQLGTAAFMKAWDTGEQWISQDHGLEALLALGLQETSLDQKPVEKPGGLSQREREVAQLIVQGKSNREIAEALTVDIKTVESHINHIFNKLGLDSRVQIAVWAMEKGLARPLEDLPGPN